MAGSDNLENESNEISERRRTVLKLAAAGALTPVVGSMHATASGGIYDGPFHRSYEAAPISPSTVEFVTTEDDALSPDGDEGEGEEGLREVPRKAPESDDTATGGNGSVQKSAAEASLVESDFDGLGADDARGVVPSDNQVAVGPDHVVQAINSRWGIFDKDGNQTFEVTLDDWWANVSPMIYESDDPGRARFFEDYIIFDPRARYDRDAGRFVMLCVDFNLNTLEGGFLLSVSASDDPTGTWYNYRIPPIDNTGLIDYPQLGFDGEAIYLTQNFFDYEDGEFVGYGGATMVALDKADAYAGETADANHFTDLRNPDGSLAFTVQPADITGQTPGYFVNSRFFQGESLTVWTIEDPVADPGDSASPDPTLTNDAVRVRPYSNAPAAEQPDSEEKIDTLDTRIMRAAFDGENLWAAHAVNDARARWYEIDPAGGGDASLVQSGNFKRNGRPTFLPAIEADADGNMIFVYNTSTPRNDGDGFVNAEVAARTADTPAGEVGAFEVLQKGVDDYDYANGEEGEDDTGSQTMRWGDYNGITIDPTDGSYWVTAQYTPTPADDGPDEHLLDDDYATRIGNVTLD